MIKRVAKLLISLGVRTGDVIRDRAQTRSGRKARPMWVVLYYHAVKRGQRDRFARQMDELLRLTQPVPAGWNGPLNGAPRYCAVTFDDGFVSVMENALPELEQRGIPATLFVPSGPLGGRPEWIKDPGAAAYSEKVMSREELRTVEAGGIFTVGSHSISHPNFLHLTREQARTEFCRSRLELETVLGRRIDLFSFPHGAHDARLIELAGEAGYTRVFTIRPELVVASPETRVAGRVQADPDDWPCEFRLKLLGAYRWLAWRKH